MGQPKGGGYQKLNVNTPEGSALINQLIQQVIPNYQAAAGGFKSLLPGGEGGRPIVEAANKNFQQNTIPQILSSFGQGTKGSSSLNNALAAGGANLNTDLASQLAQMTLGASQGLGNLAAQQQSGGLSPQFAYQQRPQSFLQSLMLGGIGLGGQLGGAYLGRPGGF